MKKQITLIIWGLIISTICVSQTNSFKYQAVLRDNQNNTIKNEQVGIRISILASTTDGPAAYSEEHTVTTNSQGLIFLNIGEGSILSGNFSTIDWGSDGHDLKIEIDRNNAGYKSMGVTPLLSVPYALHAQTVVDKNDADADPINELQTITISNDTIYLSKGGAIKLPTATTGFSGSYNDLTDVPTTLDTDSTDDFSGDYEDLINKPKLEGDVNGDLNTNQVTKIRGQDISEGTPATGQVLKWNGSAWAPGSDATVAGGESDGVVESVSVTGSSSKTVTLGLSGDAPSSSLTADFTDLVNDADADATNELQDLNLNGNILTITNNGTATEIDLSAYLDDTDTQLTETEVDAMVENNGYLSSFTEVDGSITNEIQDLSLSGNILTITNNGTATEIDLSTYLDDTQLTETEVDAMVENNGYLTSFTEVDASVTNEIQELSIAGDTIKLNNGGGEVKLPAKVLGSESGEVLFCVVNNNKDTVFAVYEGGVRIYVDEAKSKAAKGGFAVATRNSLKGDVNDILNVTSDSVRIYINESTKAAKGGFAVATRNSLKGNTDEIFNISEDSVRIYLNENTGKAAKGGFAVATRNSLKGSFDNILDINNDSVRIYIDESTKAAKGGFAVATRNSLKGSTQDILNVTPDSVRMYFEQNAKAAKGGFAVATRNSIKAGLNEVFNISTSAIAETINNESKIMWYPEKSALLAGELNIPSPDSVGEYSMALGYRNNAIGNWSQAMGYKSVARGNYSTAIGFEAVADINSFAFGTGTEALGYNSFAFGAKGVDATGTPLETITTATGDYSFAFGLGSSSSGIGSFVLGANCEASGNFSTAAGFGTTASGLNSTAFGVANNSSGDVSFTMGSGNTAVGDNSMALGVNNTSTGRSSISFGIDNQAIGDYSFVGGYSNIVEGVSAFAVGSNNTAEGDGSIAAGQFNTCTQTTSAAFGAGNTSSGSRSFAIGYSTTAGGTNAFSSGFECGATGDNSFAIGYSTTASVNGAFSSGFSTNASGNYSFATGYTSSATGSYSLSAGQGTDAYSYASIAIGRYNTTTGSQTGWVSTDPLLVAGNGTTEWTTSDAMVLYKNGNMTISGSYAKSSDKRLKDNITALENVLPNVLNISPVYFEYKNKDAHPIGRHIGFLAQEVQKDFPELVHENSTGYLAMEYDNMTAVLLQAIKEQQEIIEKQDLKNQELEAQLEQILKRLKKLEGK